MLSESTKSVKLVYIIVLTTPTSMQTDDKIVDVSTIIILQMQYLQYFRSKITVVPYTVTLDFKRLSLNSKSESIYKPWGRRLATF